jgi:tetratricopeptide (TPR) repeat protein
LEARADALHILGQIALDEDRREDAMRTLDEARRLHRAAGDSRQLARDDSVLATIHAGRGEFADALQLLNECIDEGQRTQDKPIECYCRTIVVRTLVQIGDFDAARNELKLTQPLVSDEEASINLEYQQASIEQETKKHHRAIAIFKRVLERSARVPSGFRPYNTELNLAYSTAEVHDFEEAQQHLDNAAFLDPDHVKELDLAWAAAQVNYRRGHLPEAAALTDKYVRLQDEKGAELDERIYVATLRAQIELDLGDLKSAEHWAQYAVDQAENIRRVQPAIDLRPKVLAKRRMPYELLFLALARSNQFEAAAMVFDQWQGRTVQDALADRGSTGAHDRLGIFDDLIQLRRWSRSMPSAAFAKSANRDAVLQTMRSIDLLAWIVADNEVWLLTANHGVPRLRQVGAWVEIKEMVDKFRGHPTKPEGAAALGALLVPAEDFRATQEALNVIVDGRLGSLPVPALRYGGIPLAHQRPIVRLLRLPEVPCAPAAPAGHATVIGNPTGDLYNAQIEAAQVAAQLGTTSVTGPAATKAALFAARGDAVLHLATHGALGANGMALVLAGHETVSAMEISARQLGPSLVVLSACDSATSSEQDLEFAGSLASGFLAAGSQRVVATLQSVADIGAFAVSTRFYEAGGVADPARALARVQAELANTSNTTWPYFAVFGSDVCSENASDHK